MKLRHCINVNDFRRLAKSRLPAPIYHYLEGGADDEHSLQMNEAAFADYSLMPQVLHDVSEVDTHCTVLGARLAAPILLAPTGMNRLFHHDKEIGVARAATEANVYYSLSTMATTSIERIAETGSGAKLLQLYIHRDRSLTQDLVSRARDAQYDAICLTVDTPLAGNRERDVRTGFVMPPRPTFGSLASFAMRPGWVWHYLRDSDFDLANISGHLKSRGSGVTGVISYVNDQFDRSLTWPDAEALIGEWQGPFAIKGILSAADAKRAAECGASAVIISNHGGRQLDHVPAPLQQVAEIRREAGDDIEIIVEGGIRRGTDIIKALALGADAVSLGRPYLYALAAGGYRGVLRMLRLLIEELKRDMALLGCASIDDIRSDHIKRNAFTGS